MHITRRAFMLKPLIALCFASASLLGCASKPALLHPTSWHMPWRKPAPPPPEVVTELAVQASDGASSPTLPQYWNRNTLRVDLSGIAGGGSLQLLPSAVNGWPLRIEFAVRPGSIQQLEVSGEKRVVFNVASSGEQELLPLGSGVYSAATKALTLRWE